MNRLLTFTLIIIIILILLSKSVYIIFNFNFCPGTNVALALFNFTLLAACTVCVPYPSLTGNIVTDMQITIITIIAFCRNSYRHELSTSFIFIVKKERSEFTLNSDRAFIFAILLHI